MNLLERYLQAVAWGLPKARRADILAELRDNLRSQMDDREEDLGRPLTEDEQAEILKKHGNPAIVAGRYYKRNLGFAFGVQLIGPELFPIYRTVLGIVLGISLAVLAIVIPVVLEITHQKVTMERVLTPLVLQFVAVTLIFILIERGKDHWLNQWDPRKLSQVKENREDGPSATNIFNLIVFAAGILWLAATPRWPFLMLGPATWFLDKIPMRLMPSWTEFYWAIVAILCAQLLLQLCGLFRLVPRRQARIINLILKVVGLGIGVWLLAAGPNYVTSEIKDFAHWANLSFQISLLVWFVFSVWEIVRLVITQTRERDQMLPARQN
jgi:hypothetical protein